MSVPATERLIARGSISAPRAGALEVAGEHDAVLRDGSHHVGPQGYLSSASACTCHPGCTPGVMRKRAARAATKGALLPERRDGAARGPPVLVLQQLPPAHRQLGAESPERTLADGGLSSIDSVPALPRLGAFLTT